MLKPFQLTSTSKSYKYIKSHVFKTIIFIFSDKYGVTHFSKWLGFQKESEFLQQFILLHYEIEFYDNVVHLVYCLGRTDVSNQIPSVEEQAVCLR